VQLWRSLDKIFPGTSIKDPDRLVYLTMVSAIQVVGGCGVFSSKCINLKVSTKAIYH